MLKVIVKFTNVKELDFLRKFGGKHHIVPLLFGGLQEKNRAVIVLPYIENGKSFHDLSNSEVRSLMQQLLQVHPALLKRL